MKNKVISALVAVTLAFGLWLYVITVISPDQTRPYYKVPVVLDNQNALSERQLMLVSDPNPTVTVELAGTRSDLNKINASNLTIVAELGGITQPGEYLVGYSVTPPNDILTGPITVQGRDPQQIQVKVAERVSKEVPVKIKFEGNIPDGYIKGTPELDYSEIKVAGPKEVVEQIDHAAIKVDLINRTESISQSYRYELQNSEGEPLDVKLVTTNVEKVRLQLRISAIKKVPLKVKIVAGGGATEATCTYQVSPAQISIAGSETVLKSINEIVIGTVNLADFSTSATKDFEILLPEGVTNESGVNKATVTISFPTLRKKTFDISNIQTVEVPEGMEADVLTKMLTITIRGPEDQVTAVQASDISVQVNLASVTGAEMVEPVITISDKFPDLGPVGKYSVSVMVSPANAETSES